MGVRLFFVAGVVSAMTAGLGSTAASADEIDYQCGHTICRVDPRTGARGPLYDDGHTYFGTAVAANGSLRVLARDDGVHLVGADGTMRRLTAPDGTNVKGAPMSVSPDGSSVLAGGWVFGPSGSPLGRISGPALLGRTDPIARPEICEINLTDGSCRRSLLPGGSAPPAPAPGEMGVAYSPAATSPDGRWLSVTRAQNEPPKDDPGCDTSVNGGKDCLGTPPLYLANADERLVDVDGGRFVGKPWNQREVSAPPPTFNGSATVFPPVFVDPPVGSAFAPDSTQLAMLDGHTLTVTSLPDLAAHAPISLGRSSLPVGGGLTWARGVEPSELPSIPAQHVLASPTGFLSVRMTCANTTPGCAASAGLSTGRWLADFKPVWVGSSGRVELAFTRRMRRAWHARGKRASVTLTLRPLPGGSPRRVRLPVVAPCARVSARGGGPPYLALPSVRGCDYDPQALFEVAAVDPDEVDVTYLCHEGPPTRADAAHCRKLASLRKRFVCIKTARKSYACTARHGHRERVAFRPYDLSDTLPAP